MNAKWFGVFALIIVAISLLIVPSCGYNQHLVSIQIQPSGATFLAADTSAYVNFTATGTYIHPPSTKDITSLVTWKSDTPQVALVTSAGVVSPASNNPASCGTANVFATFYDSPNQVTSNSAFITVDGPASLGCPQSGQLSNLSVTIGSGTGTVTSSPAGITCGTTCAAEFTTGTTVELTAAPTAPSSTVTWMNCDSSTATVCTVLLSADRVVTADFN
jgi:hypothetical protein